jgi:pyruvate/2-oxoglutarate dehydrogenase complex dihydrolipoamide dehydrogenase (E3) component
MKDILHKGNKLQTSKPMNKQKNIKSNKQSSITGEIIVIAVGGRPSKLGIPGGEFAISSDDIFWRQEPPGKTLVVGGGCKLIFFIVFNIF